MADHSMGRKFVLPIVLAILVAVIGAYLISSRSNEPEPVRIGSFSVAIDYAPYLVAKNNGDIEKAFADIGRNVEFIEFQSLAPINEAFATDRVDFVFEAAPPAIIGRSAGIPVSVVGISASLEQEIIVPASSTINTAVDLGGAKVGVLAGTSSHFGILKTLESAGLAPTSVEIIDLVPPDAKAAFASNQIDAWAVWPPFVEQELVAGTGRVVAGGEAQIHSIIAARDGILEDQEVREALIGTIEKTKKWMIENPEAAKAQISSILSLDADVVDLAWPKHDWAAQIDGAVIADLEEKAEFLLREGVIRETVDIENDLVR